MRRMVCTPLEKKTSIALCKCIACKRRETSLILYRDRRVITTSTQWGFREKSQQFAEILLVIVLFSVEYLICMNLQDAG